MRREVNAMIRDPVLREVVCPDFFRALASADLTASVLGNGILLFLKLELVESLAENLHCLRLVLDL